MARSASQSTLYQVLQSAPQQVAGKEGGGPNLHALAAWQYLVQRGYSEVTSYQPATRFWALQWIEAGWLLGVVGAAHRHHPVAGPSPGNLKTGQSAPCPRRRVSTASKDRPVRR